MMIVTELKVVFQTLKPHIVAYRDYKYFNNKKFGPGIEGFASEKNLKCFKRQAPVKRKYVAANEVPSMAKNLHKAIMKRSRLTTFNGTLVKRS